MRLAVEAPAAIKVARKHLANNLYSQCIGQSSLGEDCDALYSIKERVMLAHIKVTPPVHQLSELSRRVSAAAEADRLHCPKQQGPCGVQRSCR